MEGARVQHVSVGLQHVAALAVSTQMRQLPGRAQVHLVPVYCTVHHCSVLRLVSGG